MSETAGGIPRRRVLATSVLIALVLGLVWLGPAANADPPGNNGTVKINGSPSDDHPGNEPHVGCMLQVEFYGFDQGDLDALVTFAAQPPTGRDVLLTDRVGIGEDAAGGGTDLDASVTYNLGPALVGYEPHSQGFHIRLTVEAEGSIGADTKHKVFWVDGCSTTSTTTAPSTTTTEGNA